MSRTLLGFMLMLALCGGILPSTVPAEPLTFAVYQPPLRGAPLSRVGAGSRGATTDDDLNLCALAPDHLGWTSKAQPVLYWYSSRPLSTSLTFTLAKLADNRILLQQPLTATQAGMQPIELADFGFHLEQGQDYVWRIDYPEANVTIGGEIRFIAPAATLLSALKKNPQRQAELFAAQGLWYDAIASLSTDIVRTAEPNRLHLQRARWLEQVNLPIVTAFDRAQAARADKN